VGDGSDPVVAHGALTAHFYQRCDIESDGVMPKNSIEVENGSISVGWSKEYPEAQLGVIWADDKSLFVDFNERTQVNALIRTLRQARDGAFGRDE
jgi:hypothetical protein